MPRSNKTKKYQKPDTMKSLLLSPDDAISHLLQNEITLLMNNHYVHRLVNGKGSKHIVEAFGKY